MEYVEQRDGGYYVAGTRIGLGLIVSAYYRGASPEEIAHSFPLLTPELVYGSIAYYLHNQEEVDRWLKQEDESIEQAATEARKRNPALYDRLDAALADVRKAR